jgi:phosphopantetheine adenylyltransferase
MLTFKERIELAKAILSKPQMNKVRSSINWFKNSIASLMVKLLVRGLKKKFIGSDSET